MTIFNGKIIDEEGKILLYKYKGVDREALNIKNKSFGFRFKGKHQNEVAGIYNLGYENRKDPAYYWNGMTRDETDKIIFQYTLNGRGCIEINGQKFPLEPEDAFFVYTPSNYKYYLPKESENWEFIFITFFGHEAKKIFEWITKQNKNVFKINRHSPAIEKLFSMLYMATNNELEDAFITSALVYTFLMKLSRHLFDKKHKTWPEPITQAVSYMKQNYHKQLTLNDIVKVTGITKYHFSRLFKKTMHTTPMKYLTKVRIKKSVQLLKDKTLTINEIADLVGYSNGNYFNKVFRSYLGVSPGKYRESKTVLPVDKITLE